MGRGMPPIFFFYPCITQTSGCVPECHGIYRRRMPGNYVWTVKTFGYLRDEGFCCELTGVLPPEGIVVSHRDFLGSQMRPGERQLFVCIMADTRRHPYAQLHVVQNPWDPLVTGEDSHWPSVFIPHWTESGLVARDSSRGDQFQNISYFGSRFNLAPGLRGRQWENTLRDNGFQWRLRAPHSWNDYSDTDAVVAVRSFAQIPYFKTPATKLYNAWTAGVPAVLGFESASRAERKSPLDYIEVRSRKDILRALIRLREDTPYRMAIVNNGLARAREVEPSRTVHRWIEFLENTAAPAYHGWCARNAREKQDFFHCRSCSYLRFRAQDAFDSIHRHTTEVLASRR